MNAAGDRLQDTARRAALALPDVSHGYPFTPGLDVYKIAGKVLLIVTDDPDEQIITVKREPEHARAQERGYASITPGPLPRQTPLDLTGAGTRHHRAAGACETVSTSALPPT